MSNAGHVLINLVGFTPSTRTLLKSTFAGFARKGRAFSEVDSSVTPSLYLIDSDDTAACEAWRRAHPKHIDAPVVCVGHAPFGLTVPTMPKPLQWGKLYEVLTAALEDAAPRWNNEQLVRAESRVPTMHTGLSASTAARSSGMSSTVSVEQDSGRKKILVVDDSATVRHYMMLKLAPYGYSVEYAESGESAIEKCKTNSYALVFMDVVMTGIDGYETSKVIRPMLQTGTPIIMVTTRDSPFDKMKGTLAGCSAYLVKPLDEQAISDVLAKWLKVPLTR